MSLVAATTPTDPSPPVSTRTFWSFWAFSLIGAPLLALLSFGGLLAARFVPDVTAGVFVVALLAMFVFGLIERRTPVTPAMAIGGFVTAAAATLAWGFTIAFVLFQIACSGSNQCFS